MSNTKLTIMLSQMLFRALFICAIALLLAPVLSGQTLEIWEIQGSENVSPYLGQQVTTNANVVTAAGPDFFFLQTPTERSDNDPNTSDGLFVYTGNFPGVDVGELVDLTGIVREFEGLTEISGFGLSYELSGGTAELPAPVILTEDFPTTAAATVRDLERIENMRVSFAAQVVEGSGSDEIAALRVGSPRPFREAGIQYPGEGGLPEWDGNPEIFWIDPNALNAPNNRFLSFGMNVEGTGVMYQYEDFYIAFPSTYSVSGTAFERNIRSRNSQEVSIGCLNVKQLFTSNSDYDTKLSKLSRYIVQRMGGPDIVALQELGSLAALQDLAFYIDQIDTELDYAPYLLVGNGFISTAYLVSPRIQNVQVTQLAPNENLSIGGRKHDRPPLLLEGNLPTDPPIPISVLNLHVRSLLGIEGSDQDFVRTKRYEQSISIAEMVQARQDQNLVVLGDFNAYQYSDGYVDVVNQIAGTSTLGAEYPVLDIVNPPLTNHVLTLPVEEHYSFLYLGSATLLDHCLTTNFNNLFISEFAFARGNADLSVAYEDNANLMGRSSDHDGFVLFLEPEFPVQVETGGAEQRLQVTVPNPFQLAQDRIALENRNGNVHLRLWAMDGRLVWELETVETQVSLPTQLTTGIYSLEVISGKARHVVKMMIAH